jgi:YaiO family outer membrane protein
MIRKASFLVILSLTCVAARGFAAQADVDDAIRQSRELAAKQRYGDALTLLARAESEQPDNVDLKLTSANVLSWQGNYQAAENKLGEIDPKHSSDPDPMLVRANLAYYQQDYPVATKLYGNILAGHPDYEDAKTGLANAEKAQESPPDSADYKWQANLGYEHSSFARGPQTGWNQEFVQLTRFLDNGDTALHGKVTRYDEFNNTDMQVEAGVDHRFTPYLNGYLYGSHTVDASFEPLWGMSTGGNLRVKPAEESVPAVWITLDAREDEYRQVSVATFDPGLRLESGDWALSPNLVMVHQWGSSSAYGWNVRLDGPVDDGLRFYVGYADAPDTENAITLDTASAYGGLSYNIDERNAIRLGYTHDDRQNSYIRHVIDASVSRRF